MLHLQDEFTLWTSIMLLLVLYDLLFLYYLEEYFCVVEFDQQRTIRMIRSLNHPTLAQVTLHTHRQHNINMMLSSIDAQ